MQRVLTSNVPIVKLRGKWDLEVPLWVFGPHILILGKLTCLHKGDWIAYYTFDIVHNEAWSLIEYKTRGATVKPLAENVTSDHYHAVQGNLLVVKYHFIENIFVD